MNQLIEKLLKHLDIEELVQDIMSKLVLKDFDMYFVVDQQPDVEDYDFLGMAYSLKAARGLLEERESNGHIYEGKIFRFDMGKLVTLVEKFGGTEEV
jgi:hypothetical protein